MSEQKIIDDDGNFHAEDEEIDLSDTIAEGSRCSTNSSRGMW